MSYDTQRSYLFLHVSFVPAGHTCVGFTCPSPSTVTILEDNCLLPCSLPFTSSGSKILTWLKVSTMCNLLCVSVCLCLLTSFTEFLYKLYLAPCFTVVIPLNLPLNHYSCTTIRVYVHIYGPKFYLQKISTWRHHRKIHRYTVQWQSKLQQSLIASDHQLFPLSPFIVSGLFCLPEIHHSMIFQADSTLL